MKQREAFKGHQKVGESIFRSSEKWLVKKYVSKVPKFIETYHLTYTTVIWSGLIILFSYFARENLNWLWLVSLMIVLQYITDLFDGAVGRYRNTGLVKWGYFMDHFLDYVFLCSIIIGYSLLLPIESIYYMIFILVVSLGYMTCSFLSFAAINEFKIYYFRFGPTEIRLAFILLNIFLIFFGTNFMEISLPYILILLFIGLIILVYRIQKHIWKIDMKLKNKRK